MTQVSRRVRARWLCSAACAATLIGGGARAQELPSGGTVTAGSATIGGGPGGLTVQQGSARAVIDWKSFGIGAGGHVTIDQPDAGSALLNRVTGSDISTIAGSLSANGQVFLVNRNGIIVSADGKIDARGGFIGSTLDISNEDFMAGRLRFGGGGAGSVINRGTIAGGAVALLGANVLNEGLIVSSLGKVALGSGQSATLDLNGDGLLQVALPADAVDANGRALVGNSGRIESHGGLVVLKAATARDAVRQAVNMSGVIRATGVASDGGAVVFDGGEGGRVAISGSVDVSGSNGGRIDATGQSVAVEGGQLTATGVTRGGLVRLGGAFQGGTSSIATAALTDRFNDRFGPVGALAAAETTSLDAASVIDITGGTSGGAAVLWSTLSTSQQGILIAPNSAVELSSLGHLTTNLSAVRTSQGSALLLDPKNIFVADDSTFGAGGFNTRTPLPPSGSVDYADPGADPDTTYFKVGDILAQMNAGTDVILRASNDIYWQTSNAAVDFRFASAGQSGGLTLAAGRSVGMGGALTLYSSDLTLIANDSLANGVIDADRDPGQAGIDTFNATISAQVSSGQTAGDIRFMLGTGAGLTNNAVTSSNRIGALSGHDITLDNNGQSTRWAFFGSQQPGGPAGPIALAATNAVRITGAISISSSEGLTVSGRTVTWTDEATRTITASAGASIRFIENGVTTRYGLGAGSGEGGTADMTRVGLGNGGAYAAIRYGDANPATVDYHITSGALRGDDTLADLAADLTIVSGGLPAANASVGTYAVTTRATVDTTGTVQGYFYDLTTTSDALSITPRTLTATLSNGSYVYGAPAALVSLAGVINGDLVAPVATLDAASGTTMTGIAAGFGFVNTLAAGNHGYALTGLTGAGAGNYTLAFNGASGGSIAIAPRALTYQIGDTSAIYGTIGAPGSSLAGGIIGSDAVSLAIASPGLSTTAGVGTYALTGTGLTGAAAGNYVLGTTGNVDAILTVAPRPLTYTTIGGTAVYGTAATIAAPTLSGVINGDQVGAIATSFTASSFDASTAAGSYLLGAALTGAGAGNYAVSDVGSTRGTLTIQRRPVSFTITSATGVYGTPAAVLTLDGLTGFDSVSPLLSADGSTVALLSLGTNGYGFAADAGAHSFVFDGLQGAGAANYSLDLGAADRSGIYTVTPKPITYTIGTSSQVFRTAVAMPTVALDGVLGQDLGRVDATGLTANGIAITDANGFFPLDAGSYTLAIGGLSGLSAGNYTLASTGNVTGLRTVTPATVSWAMLGNASSTYGTPASLPGAVLSNTYFADDVQGVVSVLAGGSAVGLTYRTAAGTYTLGVSGLSGANAGNYQLSSTGNTVSTLTIDTKPITFAIGSSSIVYGQTPDNLDATLTGVVAGDAITGLVGLSNGVQGGPVTPLPAIFTVGGYPYQLGVGALAGDAAANYTIATSGNTFGSVTVTPKTLTYQIGSATRVYGEATGLGNAVLTGIVNGDIITATPVIVGPNGYRADDSGLRVGSYVASIAGFQGAQEHNYVLGTNGNTNGLLTITPKPIFALVSLTYTNDLQYGTLQPGLGFARATLGGLVANNVDAVLAYSAQTASGAGFLQAGSYTGTVTGLTGPDAGNYSLAGTNVVTLRVAPKSLSSSIDTVTSIYGTPATLPAASLGGVLSGDRVTAGAVQVLQGDTPITLGAQTPAGAYVTLVPDLSGADAANYASASGTGWLFINRKTITATGGASTGIYGTLATLAAPTLAGIVGQDDVRAASSTLIYQGNSSHALGDRTNAGTYSTTVAAGLTGAAAGNYILAPNSAPGTLVIAPRTIGFTLDYTSQSGIYGAQFASPIQLQGVLAGDQLSTFAYAVLTAKPANSLDAVGDSATLDALSVGTYSVVGRARNGGLALGGDSAGNYRVPIAGLAASSERTAALGTIAITPRALTYSLTATPSVVYGTAPSIALGFGNTLDRLPFSYTLTATNAATGFDLGPAGSYDRVSVGTYTVAPQLTGSSAWNYTLTGQTAALAVTPKTLTPGLGNQSVVYGDSLPRFVTLDGVLAGDQVTPNAAFGSTILSTTQGANGYDLGPVTLDVGKPQYEVTTLSGAQAGNYSLLNGGFAGLLIISPRTITYSVEAVTGQYGGITAPFAACPQDPFCMLRTETGFTTGAVTFGNIVDADRNAVTGTVLLTDGSRTFGYATNTPVGTYLQAVSAIQGAKAGNYRLATTGNTGGLMEIQQAWVKVDVSGGGRILNNGSLTDFISVETPGVPSIIRSYNNGSLGSGTVTGFLPGDDVGVTITIRQANGAPYTGDGIFLVGDYQFVPTGLTGAAASNYRLMPMAGSVYPTSIGSTPGLFTVVDSSLFSFTFLTDTPSAAYTPPASVTTFQPSLNASATASATGSATTTTTATSFTAAAGGSVNTQATVSYGDVGLSASAAADAQAIASFGLSGVNIAASANAAVSTTLSIGPGSISYGAGASASNLTTIGATGLTAKTEATASVNQTAGVGGSLGNGATGTLSSAAEAYASAENLTTAGYKDGTLKIEQKSFVGVGGSIGASGSVSGGGVTGSAGVKLYSPGSLGLGVGSTSGYSNGTVTIGFTFGISLGIGGLEISPSFSFPTAQLESAAYAINDFFIRPKPQQDPCTGNPECFIRRDTLTAADLAKKGPSLELMGYIASHPDIVQYAISHYDLPGMPELARLHSDYGGVPAQLTSVVQQEQALARKLNASPGSITLADMQLAHSLRQQEAVLVAKAGDVGGKIVVKDGTIKLAPK